jgi:hypothetical protein
MDGAWPTRSAVPQSRSPQRWSGVLSQTIVAPDRGSPGQGGEIEFGGRRDIGAAGRPHLGERPSIVLQFGRGDAISGNDEMEVAHVRISRAEEDAHVARHSRQDQRRGFEIFE